MGISLSAEIWYPGSSHPTESSFDRLSFALFAVSQDQSRTASNLTAP